jgi:hypothetical protein
MKPVLIRPQRDLFENAGPPVAVPDDQKQRLVLLIQALLSEIASAPLRGLTKQENGDDEDYA